MDQPTDAQIIEFEKAIKQEYMSKDLIGEKIPIHELFAEFQDSSDIFNGKLKALSLAFSNMRKVRKDGNCFYRAFAFSFAEQAINNPNAKKVLQETHTLMTNCGYDMELLSDFYQVFVDACSLSDLEEVVQFFNVEYQSDTIVCYLRLVTAGILKRDADNYEAFIMDSFPSLQEFISSQVEPMNVEADQIQIVAIANAFNSSFKIANLDHSLVADNGINYHEISSQGNVSFRVLLLFRPGHYDVLYE